MAVSYLTNMRVFLIRLMATFTGKPRYFPEIEWSDKSWTHNFFRFLELIFGREVGIRIEASSTPTSYTVYTVEALLAFIETRIRELPKLLSFKLITLVPNPNNGVIKLPGIMFAIAFDAKSVGTQTGTSPITWSHTCTGSNGLLVVEATLLTTGSPTVSTPTYNSVSMTNADSQITYNSSQNILALYFLTGPSTGSNTVSIAFTGTSPGINGAATSYTGVNSSGQPDAHNHNTGTAANVSVAVTTVADNCWVVGAFASMNTSAVTAGQTDRENFLYGSSNRKADLQDTNAVVHPAGSQTMSWTNNSAVYAVIGASFAPAVAGGTQYYSFLSTLGVG